MENPFKKEAYSLEKTNKLKEEIESTKTDLSWSGSLSHNDLTKSDKLERSEWIKKVGGGLKLMQKKFDKQFELGRTEATELNKEYDRMTENVINSSLDGIKFRMEKLGQTKEEAVAELTALVENILSEIKKE